MIRSGRQHKFLIELLSRIAIPGETVVDLGTPCRFAKELRFAEAMFADVNYKAYGYEPKLVYGKYNCDGHIDVLNMSFESESVDSIICLDVLEHVENPFHAINEMRRVLKPSGSVLLSVPFLNGFHGKSGASSSHEDYPDYWRFTHQGLNLMFKDFSSVMIYPVNGPIETRLYFLKLNSFLNFRFVRKIVDVLDMPVLGKSTTRHFVYAKK